MSQGRQGLMRLVMEPRGPSLSPPSTLDFMRVGTGGSGRNRRAGTMEGRGRQRGGGVCETVDCQNRLTRSKSDQRARAASLLWNKL